MAMEARERLTAHLAEADLSGGSPAPAPATALLQGTVEQFEKVIDLERNLLRKSITKLQHDLDQSDTELNLKEEEMVIWEQRLHQIQQDNEVKLRLARVRVESKKYGQKSEGSQRTSAQSPSALGFIAEGDEDSEGEDDDLGASPSPTPGASPAEVHVEPGAPDTPPRGRGVAGHEAQLVNELAASVVEEIAVLRRRWQQLLEASQVRTPPNMGRAAVRSAVPAAPVSSPSNPDRQQEPHGAAEIWERLEQTRSRLREVQQSTGDSAAKEVMRPDGTANRAEFVSAFGNSSTIRYPSRPSEPTVGDPRRQHLPVAPIGAAHLGGGMVTSGHHAVAQHPIMVGRSVTGDSSVPDGSAGTSAGVMSRGEHPGHIRQPAENLDGSAAASAMPSAFPRGIGFNVMPPTGVDQSTQHELAQRSLRPPQPAQANLPQTAGQHAPVPMMNYAVSSGAHYMSPGVVGHRVGYPPASGYAVGTPQQIQMPPQYSQQRPAVAAQRQWQG